MTLYNSAVWLKTNKGACLQRSLPAPRFTSGCETTAATSQWADSSSLQPTKTTSTLPTCANYSYSNQQRTDCREHVATMTWLGKGISFHLTPIQAGFFSFSQVLHGTSMGFLLTSLKVTVFVVYNFRSVTLETVWAHSQRCLQLRLGQVWGYKHGVEWWMWNSHSIHIRKNEFSLQFSHYLN